MQGDLQETCCPISTSGVSMRCLSTLLHSPIFTIYPLCISPQGWLKHGRKDEQLHPANLAFFIAQCVIFAQEGCVFLPADYDPWPYKFEFFCHFKNFNSVLLVCVGGSDSSLLPLQPFFWVPPMEHQIIGAPKSEQGTQQTSSLSNVSIPTLTHLPPDDAIPSISEHTQLMEQWETLLKTGLKMDRLSSPTQQLTNRIAHYIRHSRGGESIFRAQTTWKSRGREAAVL